MDVDKFKREMPKIFSSEYADVESRLIVFRRVASTINSEALMHHKKIHQKDMKVLEELIKTQYFTEQFDGKLRLGERALKVYYKAIPL